ncbi:MAG: sigma-70 family RNA polymerase sigma factor [Nitrospirae bacterium]|nr:sigma-70 family RNA polymerase sigma factor [Nitrospirota bacterium]
MTNVPCGPENWVEQHGDYLYRFALSRLRDANTAEDVLQEAFLAALQSRHRFEGRSSERNWLAGILKHKILDHFRRGGREVGLGDRDEPANMDAEVFGEDGHWKLDENSPADWADPDRTLEQSRFWEAMGRCLGELPPRTARAYTLREIEEEETDAICKTLNITPTNLWVILHRARMHLRQCLELHWIGGTTT